MSARYSFLPILQHPASKWSDRLNWAARNAGRGLTVAALLACAGAAQAQDDGSSASAPLSAIDWLSESVTAPRVAAAPVATPERGPVDEPPVTDSAQSPQVTVSSLDAASPDATGLLSSHITGLPTDLWSGSDEATLTALVGAAGVETLPAIQDLLVTLILAEAAPPAGAGPQGALFLARVDKLLDMGALDPAQALLEAAGPDTPELFRRFFDVSLLTGTEDAACAVLRGQPGLAPTIPARIFCLARTDDWQAAALTLGTARALGQITPEEDLLLTAFLDAGTAETMGTLPPPPRPSPLQFRIREAIGEGMVTARMPLAFAHADLRPTAAWRNQMAAAERLIRTGALEENVLQALYTERVASVSGGIYDRARAFQAFDAAFSAGDIDRIAETLPPVWDAMIEVRAEVAFARLYGAALGGMDLTGPTARLANRIAMLAPAYRQTAARFAPLSAQERLWQAVALDDVADITGTTPRARAVLAAFQGAPPPALLAEKIEDGRIGEALLRAISLVQQALSGDVDAMTDALAVLIDAGLDDTARRAALQYLILERGQ